ncbi:hypothetical protein ACPA9J_04130 [Pseudomonas aeruginosa]
MIAEPDKGRCFSHSFTYSGHPVALRGGAEEHPRSSSARGLLAHADEVGRYFEERLQSLPRPAHRRRRARDALHGLCRVRRRQGEQGAVSRKA